MFKFLKENITRFNVNTKKFYHGRYLRAWISLFYCAIRFGCSFDDYYRYEFYKKSNYERNKFMTYRRSKRIIRKYNTKEEIRYFYDKETFNKKFAKYIKREFLVLKNSSQEELKEFLSRHDQVILKPTNGSKGAGILKLEKKQFGQIKKEDYENYIIEEVLIQHEELSAVHPSSVNTLRVITFKGEIVACALRVGCGNGAVDNFSLQGICGCVDVESGMIMSPFKNVNLDKFAYHPTTGVKIIGLQIPNWEKCKDFAKELALEVPNVNYVGWDIAVLENGFAVIEGNHDPGHRIMQSIAQTGMYEKIKEIIKKSK